MLDILFIYPPYERLMGLKPDTFPASIGVIATVLKNAGYKTAIFNAEVGMKSGSADYSYTPDGRSSAFTNFKKNLHGEHKVWDEIENVIKTYQPKILGITSYSPTHSAAVRIAALGKKICRCQTVVGGPYPTLLPEEACSNENIDFVISGEGEYSMLELVNCSLADQGNINEIKGLSYKKNGKCITNPRRERITDLDALPFVDHSLLLYKELHSSESLSTLVASRGCPHQCTFCASVPLWGKKVIFRSADSLLDEIERNYDLFKNKSFTFFDDTFTSSLKRVCEFCDKFIDRGLHRKIKSWKCLSRVNTVNEELIQSLEKANCRKIALGIESGSEKILKSLKKGITKDQVREKVSLIKKSKLMLHLYFMIGSPYETEEDILETAEFIRELTPDTMNLCTFTPYYGTELYDVCVSKGLLPKTHDISIYENIGHHNKENYFCLDIPKERYYELEMMMMELADNICNRTNKKKFFNKSERTIDYILANPKEGIKKILKKGITVLKG